MESREAKWSDEIMEKAMGSPRTPTPVSDRVALSMVIEELNLQTDKLAELVHELRNRTVPFRIDRPEVSKNAVDTPGVHIVYGSPMAERLSYAVGRTTYLQQIVNDMIQDMDN